SLDGPGVAALWPTKPFEVEHVTLALLVVGQLGLAALGCVPGLFREWTTLAIPNKTEALAAAHGPAGWLLVALLAAPFLLLLWKQQESELEKLGFFGLTLLFITAPILWAGEHAGDLAVASALRWGLAGCFLVGSAIVWGRDAIPKLPSAENLVS